MVKQIAVRGVIDEMQCPISPFVELKRRWGGGGEWRVVYKSFFSGGNQFPLTFASF